MNDITVVKVGGSTLGQHDTTLSDIAALHAAGRKLVIVHGGGNAATEWLKIHGVASEFVDGLRVTGRTLSALRSASSRVWSTSRSSRS